MSVLPLSVRLFGKFSVQRDGEELQGFDACKVQELFSYLLIYHDRPHSREALATLLWGDNLNQKSKKYLRQTLWQLQNALGSRSGTSILRVEPDWVQLDSRPELSLDVAIFEQSFAQTQRVACQDASAEKMQLIGDAVQLYRGDLLEGWYQDWCLYERERLQNNYLAMLDKLMCYCEIRQDYEAGLVYGALILRYDRACERAHRQVMRLQYLAGNRTASLRQYERCVAALDEELGVKPDKRTVQLYEQIRADRLDVAPARNAEPELEPAATSLPEVLNRLKHLRANLSEMQEQVQQNIRAVEWFLNNAPDVARR
jgi:DNA-binding SARP family transcriptional activator